MADVPSEPLRSPKGDPGKLATAGTGASGGAATFSRSLYALPMALAGILFAIGFHDTFRVLWRTWRNNDNYSHGVLIGPIFAFLVWRLRDELRRTPLEQSTPGVFLLAAGALLQVVGVRGDVTIFQGWAVVVTLAGLVWAWFGRHWFRKLLFPIAFLFFMVPTPPAFVNLISFRLKAIATNVAVHLSQSLGVAVSQRGMELSFPTGSLTVENACSGLNSLIALLAMGALFAYFGEGAYWRRGLLFLSAVPIALAANIVRLTSLCVMAVFTTADRAGGTFHDIGGFVVYALALVLLLGSKRVLRC